MSQSQPLTEAEKQAIYEAYLQKAKPREKLVEAMAEYFRAQVSVNHPREA